MDKQGDREEKVPVQVFLQPMAECQAFSKKIAGEFQGDKRRNREKEIVPFLAKHAAERETPVWPAVKRDSVTNIGALAALCR